jgi:hypothetical protein
MRIGQFLLFLIMTAALASACTRTTAGGGSGEVDPAPTPIDRTAGAVSIAPRDPHDGRVVGEAPEIVLNMHGEEKLPRPKVWLEYPVEDKVNEASDKRVRVDLSPQTEKLLDAHWQVLFDIIEKKRDAPDLTVAKWTTIASVRETKVNTPLGERRISDYEAEDLVSFIQDSFIKYFEKRSTEQTSESSN